MFMLIKKTSIGLLTGLINGSYDTNCVSLSNQELRFNLPSLIYIIMNTGKNFITHHLLLN